MGYMHKRVSRSNFHGLTWKAATHDFTELAKEYGRSVSAEAFDNWCREHYPSSVSNSKSWHSGDSIRKFLDTFENGRELLTRLLAIENERRKIKRSLNAYDDNGDDPGNGSGSGQRRKRSNRGKRSNAPKRVTRSAPAAELRALESEIALLDRLIERRQRLNALRDEAA